jgi:hypothetical protein
VQDSAHIPDNPISATARHQGRAKPVTELLAPFLIHHNLVIFHIVTNDKVRTLVIPVNTPKLLLTTLSNDPSLIPIIKLDNNVSFGFFLISGSISMSLLIVFKKKEDCDSVSETSKTNCLSLKSTHAIVYDIVIAVLLACPRGAAIATNLWLEQHISHHSR